MDCPGVSAGVGDARIVGHSKHIHNDMQTLRTVSLVTVIASIFT